MYAITESALIDGDLATVWEIVTNVAAWPAWDPHEEAARIDGPFAEGTRGWSKPKGAPAADWTITSVEDKAQWGSQCALPGGTISGVNTFELLDGGQVRCTKTMRITGPLVPLFRVWFGPRIRRDMRLTFGALQAEVARVSANA